MADWGLKSLVLGLVLLTSTGCVSSTSRGVRGSDGRIIVTKGIGLWRKPEIGGRTAVGIGWIDSLVVELPEGCRLVVVVRSTVEAERVAPILSALQNKGDLCVIPERASKARVFSRSP